MRPQRRPSSSSNGHIHPYHSVLPYSTDERRVFTLSIHDDRVSAHQLIVNPDHLPAWREDQLLEIIPIGVEERDQRLILKGEIDREMLTKKPQIQISININVAKVFNLQHNQDVFLQTVSNSSVEAEHVELVFRDAFLGRNDMWRLRKSLEGSCVYVEQKLYSWDCFHILVKEIYINGESVASGYITANTRIVFRSKSAKYILFIQMSREMWEFDEDGELRFEKCVYGFLPQLFTRWKEHATNHSVTIILFARVYYDKDPVALSAIADECILRDPRSGRAYKDFYEVVVENENRHDWNSIIVTLKEEFLKFQHRVLLRNEGDGVAVLDGMISRAFEGNILEAVHMALNPFIKHYIDRDLMRTGLSILIVTPGSGKFLVDKKMLQLATTRMNENGVSLDLVCLSKVPLHTAPLLVFYSAPSSRTQKSATHCPATAAASSSSSTADPLDKSDAQSDQLRPDPLFSDDDLNVKATEVFMVPHWIQCNFFNGQTQTLAAPRARFEAQCKMYEVQMMGIMEHEIAGISIPWMDIVAENLEAYDEEIFCPNKENILSPVAPSASGPVLPPAATPLTTSSVDVPIATANTEEFKVGDEKQNAESTLADGGSTTLSVQSSQVSLNDNLVVAVQDATTEVNVKNLAVRAPSLMMTSINPNRTVERERQLSAALRDNSIISNGGQNTAGGAPGPRPVYPQMTASPRGIGEDEWKGPVDVYRPWPEGSSENGVGGSGARPMLDRQSSNISTTAALGMRSTKNTTPPEVDGYSAAQELAIAHQGPQQPYQQKTNYQPQSHHNPNAAHPLQLLQQNHQQGPVEAEILAEDEPALFLLAKVQPINIGRPQSRVGARRPLHQRISPSNGGGGDLYSRSSEQMRRYTRYSPSHWQPAKQTYLNPCNPSNSVRHKCRDLGRWSHVYRTPPPMELNEEIHWTSLCTPACLPLTTDHCPTKEQLGSNSFMAYTYTISPGEEQLSERAHDSQKQLQYLLDELVGQRLAQGFQLVSSPSGAGASGQFGRLFKRSNAFQASPLSRRFVASVAMEKTKSTERRGSRDDGATSLFPAQASYTLTLGHHVHELRTDYADQSIEVKRYIRNLAYDATAEIRYACAVWPKGHDKFHPRFVKFFPGDLQRFDWNALDLWICGYRVEQITAPQRYWRIRFLVIPTEIPAGSPATGAGGAMGSGGEVYSEEEMRVECYLKFLELFRKAKLGTQDEDRKLNGKREKPNTQLRIVFTTMTPAAYVTQELLNIAETNSSLVHVGPHPFPHAASPLTTDTRVDKIMHALQNGVIISDRRWGLREHRQVFVGSDLVDWILREFSDIDTRVEATRFGAQLLRRGLIEHSRRRHGFLDGFYFYRVKPPYAKPDGASARQTLVSHSIMEVSTAASGGGEKERGLQKARLSIQRHLSSPSVSSPGGFSEPAQNTIRIQLKMSNSFDASVDPSRKSDRKEIITVHYPTILSVRNCYHLHFTWLGTTTRLIDELIRFWQHQMERLGLRLVEAPVEQAPYDASDQGFNDNPFASPIPIHISVPPPSQEEVKRRLGVEINLPWLFWECELLRRHDFLLDRESESRYPFTEPTSSKLAPGTPLAEKKDLDQPDWFKHVELNRTYSYQRTKYLYTQYVHRSGVGLVQIRRPCEYLWIQNHLFLSRLSTLAPSAPSNAPPTAISNPSVPGQGSFPSGGFNSGSAPALGNTTSVVNIANNPEYYRRCLQELCEDKERMRKFWEESLDRLAEKPAVRSWKERGGVPSMPDILVEDMVLND
ncbi:uncharacterized protein VTP21DRAFT_6347 [Calcarisporiella thermophila]|uniref:uncharacterized protein n=1 Tax=Calcarisporiella thermophila TaxID=911321 RepID=UPI0037429EE7